LIALLYVVEGYQGNEERWRSDEESFEKEMAEGLTQWVSPGVDRTFFLAVDDFPGTEVIAK